MTLIADIKQASFTATPETVNTFSEMVGLLAKPGVDILLTLTDKKCHLIHMGMGCLGEIAELKEAEFARDRANFIEELGDYEFYLEGIYKSFAAKPTYYSDVLADSAYSNGLPLGLGSLIDNLHILTGDMFDSIKRYTMYNKDKEYEAILTKADKCSSLLHLFYLRNTFDVTREEVLNGNINKLLKGDKARYASDTYSDQQANARADKIEEPAPVKVSELKEEVFESDKTPEEINEILDYKTGDKTEQKVYPSAPTAIKTFSFGMAIEVAKAGNRIARQGWNGKNMFVVYMPPMQLPAFNTQGTERKVNDRTAKYIGEDQPLDVLGYFAMYTADKKWLPGWLASQTDMLANDWIALD
jgi:hypothetical protein